MGLHFYSSLELLLGNTKSIILFPVHLRVNIASTSRISLLAHLGRGVPCSGCASQWNVNLGGTRPVINLLNK